MTGLVFLPSSARQVIFSELKSTPVRSESVMRSWREIVYRAELDGREASLVRAMGIEVVRYLQRVGAPLAGVPPLAGDTVEDEGV